MANFTYNVALARAQGAGLGHLTGVFRALVLTDNADVNPDDDTLAAVLARAATTEVDDGTVTSYARQLLAFTGTTNQAGSVETDDANNRAEWRWDALTFDLATGGPVSPVGTIIYLDVAGDDSSDATAIPYYHWDTPGTNLTELILQNGANGAVITRIP